MEFFPLSQERTCLPSQPSKAQRPSLMGAADPQARPSVPVSRGAVLPGGSQQQKVSNIHQPPKSIV